MTDNVVGEQPKNRRGWCEDCGSKNVIIVREFATAEEFVDAYNAAAVPSPNPDSLASWLTAVDRCKWCGWPLKDETREGCTKDSCSQRPHPKKLYDFGAPSVAIEDEALDPCVIPMIQKWLASYSGGCRYCGMPASTVPLARAITSALSAQHEVGYRKGIEDGKKSGKDA